MNLRSMCALASVGSLASCADALTDAESTLDDELGAASDTAVAGAPVGLAIEVDNGAGVPLRVKRGQTFYVAQLDVRAGITATVDEGIGGLDKRGDFQDLSWHGVKQADQEFVLLANADSTFRRRRFYRDAAWMNTRSEFVLEQLNASGQRLGASVEVDIGTDGQRRASDDFFVRRLRAIQWTNDCPTTTDCTGAKSFEEEALVEVREAMHPEQTFALNEQTTALRLKWSLRPTKPYIIPVEQVAAPSFAYGFQIDVEPVTPARPDGTYAAGTDITFRVTLRDGAGKRLHPQGALPTYNEVIFGTNEPGIQYFRAFFDPTTTYYRRKHRERMLMAQFIGPAQRVQPIRTIIDLDKFLDQDIDVQTTGTLERDGVHAEFRTFPTANALFGGAFDPAHAGWAAPVPDTWIHHIPDNAPPGTYHTTMKGRRVYLGEDIPFTRTIEVQVGTPNRTEPVLNTGPCASCHTGPSSLGSVLHANPNRAACASCHVPLGFELEGPIFVRTHFIHSRSRRFDERGDERSESSGGGDPAGSARGAGVLPRGIDRCDSCHLTKQSIQRTSKAACLSCHNSYPGWHVAVFGPIESMYIGGGRESFEQCAAFCHRSHPNSNL